MPHRPLKFPLASRIIAAGCVAIWLAGVSACNLEALVCCDSHGSETVAYADQENSGAAKNPDVGTNDDAHDGDAHHPDEGEGHSHQSHRHDNKEASCCSTLVAVPQTAPVVFSQPAFHPIPSDSLCVVVEMHAASFATSENPPNRHAKSCDRVFTPEVWLGPAHRSLAPPALHLI